MQVLGSRMGRYSFSPEIASRSKACGNDDLIVLNKYTKKNKEDLHFMRKIPNAVSVNNPKALTK